MSNLRLIQSVGEPLNPEAVLWGVQKLKLPIHDNWWQTETGGIMIAEFFSFAANTSRFDGATTSGDRRGGIVHSKKS